MNTILRTLAIIALVLSLVATGVGGLQDVLATKSISRQHGWNDGQYLALVSIALILLSR
jgi:hypothetical protein